MTGWARAAGEAGVPLSRGDSGHSNTPHRASQVAVRAPRLPHLLWGLGSPGQALHTGLYGNQDSVTALWLRPRPSPPPPGDRQPRDDTAGRLVSLGHAMLPRPFARRSRVRARCGFRFPGRDSHAGEARNVPRPVRLPRSCSHLHYAHSHNTPRARGCLRVAKTRQAPPPGSP